MYIQQVTAISSPAQAEFQLSRLVDLWVPQLSGAEFRVAAYLYRILGQTPNHVRMSARALSEATGVSERRVETVRKTLAAKGIHSLTNQSWGQLV
jgi:hypothetical protein